MIYRLLSSFSPTNLNRFCCHNVKIIYLSFVKIYTYIYGGNYMDHNPISKAEKEKKKEKKSQQFVI